MKKHVMAITYKPKIIPVLDNSCFQTIRKGRKVSVGDSILFHGWIGKPYRSKWSWEKRVKVTMTTSIIVFDEGISIINKEGEIGPVAHWSGDYCDRLAKEDFIEPATGEELKNVLFGLNGNPSAKEEYQIIRW